MRWPAPIDHLYILCEQREEPKRAEYLRNWFTYNGIDDDSWSFVNKCYGKTLYADDAHAAYNPYVDRRPVEAMRSFNSYNMKPSEISLCINWDHFARTAISDGHKVVMMFESDVIFEHDFYKNLCEAMTLLTSNNNNWDFLSISSGAGLRPVRDAGETSIKWFPSRGPYFHTRTCDAMIFKVSMLEKIVKTFLPVAEVLDWELNYQLTLHGSHTLWLDPPIVHQGSSVHTQEYETTL